MDLELEGKVALVTGASTGIGWAAARLLAAEGAQVVGVSRSAPGELPGGVTHFACDLRDPDAPARAVGHAVSTHGQLDVVVNNAAAAVVHSGFVDEGEEAWAATINLNLMAAVRLMRSSMPHLVESRGAIVNVTSVNSRLPSSDGVSYSAAKAALLNLGKAVATEYAGQGVRVVTVSPGLTATPMWLGDEGIASQIAGSAGGDPDVIAEATANSTPLARFLTPEEVAVWICFAASPRASALTGAEIVVDGGLTPTI